MIYLGADHRGFQLKEDLKKYLEEKGLKFEDLGNDVFDPQDDYSDFAFLVARKVLLDSENRGILICGSGVGMSIAANRINGIRAGLCVFPKMAEQARSDDNINVLVLASDFFSDSWREILENFLNTPFHSEEKYQRRLEKIENPLK